MVPRTEFQMLKKYLCVSHPLKFVAGRHLNTVNAQDLVVFPAPLQWQVMEQRIKITSINFCATALTTGPLSHSV